MAVLQPKMADAAPDRGLEPDPADSATPPSSVGSPRSSATANPLGCTRSRVLGEQVADAGRSFDGHDVPGERDQVAPVAVLSEEVRRGVDITCGQGSLEVY